MYLIGSAILIIINIICINIICITLYVVNKRRQRREDAEIERRSDIMFNIYYKYKSY